MVSGRTIDSLLPMLRERSVYFEVMPCPDDEWQVAVKKDAEHIVRADVETCKKVPALIGRFMDCSTAHIHFTDAELLTHDSVRRDHILIVFKYDEGFFVHVNPEDELFEETLREAQKAGYSRWLRELLQRAKDLGCWFLRLDADGTMYDGLETHEW
jgi:hypothetical protein